jgi:hypothetical protein
MDSGLRRNDDRFAGADCEAMTERVVAAIRGGASSKP